MPRFFRYSNKTYNALSNNQQHKFAQKNALSIYRLDTIYSFIPKNACSTMRTTIAYENGCIDNRSDFNWIHKNNSTFTASLSELAKAKYTFTILRCPFSRLVSAYLDKIINRDRQAWEYIDLHHRKIQMEDITFDFFVNSMSKNPIKNGNIHWRPQNHFLVYQEYDDYFSLELFSEAEQILDEKIGLKIIDARPLTSHSIKNYEYFDAADVDLWHLKPSEILNYKRQGKLPNPKKMYNDELIKIVQEAYADDIELYKTKIGSETLMY